MTATPLSALLAQSLIGLAKDYESHDNVPPLPLWSNFLRVVPDAGLRRSDVPRAARVSRRAVAAILTGCERQGLASVEAGAGRGAALVTLTAEGRRARDVGGEALNATESRWASMFRAARDVRDDLIALVDQLDLELPHFPLGYGPVDDSVAGGRARPGSDGPPRIPPHGADWIPVVRTRDTGSDPLTLTSLLSQALVAFAIEYEQDGGSLPTTVIWQQIPDEGIAANELPDGCPNPSGWARHGSVTIDPAPLTKRSVIGLTERGRQVRDAYAARTCDVEQAWADRYGDHLVARIRRHLEHLVEDGRLGDLPHFPRISWIGGLREVS